MNKKCCTCNFFFQSIKNYFYFKPKSTTNTNMWKSGRGLRKKKKDFKYFLKEVQVMAKLNWTFSENNKTSCHRLKTIGFYMGKHSLVFISFILREKKTFL